MSMSAALQSRRNYTGPALFATVFGLFFWPPLYGQRSTFCFGCRNIWVRSHCQPNSAHSIGTSTRCSTAMWPQRLPVFCLRQIQIGRAVTGQRHAACRPRFTVARRSHLPFCFRRPSAGWVRGSSTHFSDRVAIIAAREIIAGKNWRNLRVMIILVVLIFGNIVFHAEVLLKGSANYGIRIAISSVAAYFSAAALCRASPTWLIAQSRAIAVPISRFDIATIAAGALALAASIAAPAHAVTGMLLLLVDVCDRRLYALGR